MPPGMMIAVHKYALYEIEEVTEGLTPPAPTPPPTPAQVAIPGEPISMTPFQLQTLLNNLSAGATLGPVHILADGLLLIGELTGFAHLALDQAIIPAVMGPRRN